MITLFEDYDKMLNYKLGVSNVMVPLMDIHNFFINDESTKPLHDILNFQSCLKELLVGNEVEFNSSTGTHHISIVKNIESAVDRNGIWFDIIFKSQSYRAKVLYNSNIHINNPSQKTLKYLKDLNSKMKGKRFDL